MPNTTPKRCPVHHVSFDLTDRDRALVRRIVQRALPLYKRAGVPCDRLTLTMDIEACHANGCPLRLQELLEADDFNFAHDVGGIHKYIDRRTGRLTGYFLPRFAVPQRSVRRTASR